MSTQVVTAVERGELETIEPPPATTQPAPRFERPWRRAGLVGLTTWAAAATAYALVTALSWMLKEEPGPPVARLYEAWDHWDTGHYMRISQVGYTPDRPDTHAFFPLFPMLLRVLDTILPGPTLVASLVLSNLACVGFLIVLHRFAAREFDSVTADRTLLYLMAFPTAFFLSAGYNGSLFLLLTVAALYFMRGGAWWAAGAFGALASGTRMTGVFLAVAFAVEYGRQHGWRLRAARPDALAVLLVPVGLACFAIYCWVTLGDPLAWSHAQDEWGRRLAVPWDGLRQAALVVSDQPLLTQVVLHNLIDLLAVVLAAALLTLCVVGPWRLGPEQRFLVAYSTALFAIVLIGPVAGLFPLQSAPRYVLELVPIFLLLGRFGENRLFERLYLLPATGLQVVFLLTFLNNVWIA